MTPLTFAYVFVAAICSMVGFQHAVMASRVRERWLHHVLFACSAWSVAVNALIERRLLASSTPEQYLELLPWTAVFIVTTMVMLSWFVSLRTGVTRRWMVVVLTTVAPLPVIVDFTVGIHLAEATGLRESTLPWGETIKMATGPPSAWQPVGYLTIFLFVAILLDTTFRLARRGDRRTALVIGSGVFVYCTSLLMLSPIDAGVIELPPLQTFGFLVIVGLMSWDLTDEAVRASRLSAEVRANERRWSQLIENVQLLVARIDCEGRVVSLNPYFERVLGFKAEEVIGREHWSFLPPELREGRRTAFFRAMDGEPSLEVELEMLTVTGETRHIMWRNALLRDPAGEAEGMLSLGADLTDRINAEKARDRALTELERLKNRLEEENVYLREEVRSSHGFANIVGGSDPLLYVLHKVRQVADSDTSVLIMGETGVGKELIARTIHAESPRANRPFVVVNCAALPENLIESELFGHEKGSFTGADRRRIGHFELADGGTLLLDEVGELPLGVQPRLLRVLQEGEALRVGGTQPVTFDVRVIAATNRDLKAEMTAGRFREDLFYRIAVYPITVPPLRDRREDLPLLVQHFVGLFAKRRGLCIDEVPTEVMRQLEAYRWPGNVRELKNVLERAVLTATDKVLRLAEQLDEGVGTPESGAVTTGDGTAGLTLAEVERRHIAVALEAAGGKISGSGGAAESLGLHANTLRYRMKKLGISKSGKG